MEIAALKRCLLFPWGFAAVMLHASWLTPR